MTQAESDLEHAISLMPMALALLDKAGAGVAAARLQHAIDTATDELPMRSGAEIDSATLALYFPD